MADKTYENMLVGVLLFVGGLIVAVILERYFKTGNVLPNQQALSVLPMIEEDDAVQELKEIHDTIKSTQPGGSLHTRRWTITDQVKMLYSQKSKGLHWYSFDAYNNGPDGVYISVNTSDLPESPLPSGRTLSVNFMNKGIIDKVYLRCDAGKTATVDFWVVK